MSRGEEEKLEELLSIKEGWRKSHLKVNIVSRSKYHMPTLLFSQKWEEKFHREVKAKEEQLFKEIIRTAEPPKDARLRARWEVQDKVQ